MCIICASRFLGLLVLFLMLWGIKIYEHLMPNLPIQPKGILKHDYLTMIRIHDEMMTNLGQPMPSIQTLAKKANMCSTKFRELFKKMYGQPIYNYHLRTRLNHAKTLIKQREYTLTQISYKIGFSHQPAFVNAFKKHFGLLPSEFQAMIIDDNS